MKYENSLEEKLSILEKELWEAKLNNLRFDIEVLEEEIEEVEMKLKMEFTLAYEG